MNPAYRKVTIKQLLSHTAGLPGMATDEEVSSLLAAIKSVHGVSSQRAALVRYFLSRAPANNAGEFKYSNVGFVIAGAIAEARTGKTWEELMRERVFAPLGIRNVGFGAPGRSNSYDQPRGHLETSGHLKPLDPSDPGSDNPALIGPAGTINISLKDWARFAQDQLDGPRGKGKLLTAATYRLLQTPVVNGVALGWGVSQGADGATTLLQHQGSNDYWYSDIIIFPEHDTIILVVINSGNNAAQRTIRDLGPALADHLKLHD